MSHRIGLINMSASNNQTYYNFISQDNYFIKSSKRWSWTILIISSIYQLIFFGSFSNLVAIICIIAIWIIFTRFYFRSKIIQNYPLSFLLIFGFTTTQFYFPLFFTTLEGKPVIYNLDLPFEVFFHSTLSVLVLYLAHNIYRFCTSNFTRTQKSFLLRAGLFNSPNKYQLWMMGFIGLLATLYAYLINPSISREVTGSAADKFIQSLTTFSYAPFFILLGRMYGNESITKRKVFLSLMIFTILLFALSIGRNSRGAFMIGFTSVALVYMLALFLKIYKTKLFTIKNVLISSLIFWLLTGPIADLGTAMVIVRDKRMNLSSSELISATLNVFQNKKAIQSKRVEDKEQFDWDERYLDNIFTARFSNLKFADLSLIQASKLKCPDPGMLDFSIDYILGALPDPVLKLFGLRVNKEIVYGASFGDYLYYRAGAESYVLGGFRTGNFLGTGMASFNYWYLMILGLGIIPVFFLFDKLVWRVENNYQIDANFEIGELKFSLCGLMIFFSIFQFLPSESVVTTITFMLRGWIQTIFLYILIFHLTSRISRNFF